MSGTCEWDPKNGHGAPAYWRSSADGCPNDATLSVGASTNNWHLCASCAALPRFSAFKKRPLRRAHVSDGGQ